MPFRKTVKSFVGKIKEHKAGQALSQGTVEASFPRWRELPVELRRMIVDEAVVGEARAGKLGPVVQQASRLRQTSKDLNRHVDAVPGFKAFSTQRRSAVERAEKIIDHVLENGKLPEVSLIDQIAEGPATYDYVKAMAPALQLKHEKIADRIFEAVGEIKDPHAKSDAMDVLSDYVADLSVKHRDNLAKYAQGKLKSDDLHDRYEIRSTAKIVRNLEPFHPIARQSPEVTEALAREWVSADLRAEEEALHNSAPEIRAYYDKIARLDPFDPQAFDGDRSAHLAGLQMASEKNVEAAVKDVRGFIDRNERMRSEAR